MGSTAFAYYVVAVKKRLVNHFGMSYPGAADLIDRHTAYVQAWQRERTPADEAARMLFDHCRMKQTFAAENPLPSRTLLIAGAIISAAAGLYFLVQGLRSNTEANAVQPMTPPSPAPSFNGNTPEVLQTIGPMGITPLPMAT